MGLKSAEALDLANIVGKLAYIVTSPFPALFTDIGISCLKPFMPLLRIESEDNRKHAVRGEIIVAIASPDTALASYRDTLVIL